MPKLPPALNEVPLAELNGVLPGKWTPYLWTPIPLLAIRVCDQRVVGRSEPSPLPVVQRRLRRKCRQCMRQVSLDSLEKRVACTAPEFKNKKQQDQQRQRFGSRPSRLKLGKLDCGVCAIAAGSACSRRRRRGYAPAAAAAVTSTGSSAASPRKDGRLNAAGGDRSRQSTGRSRLTSRRPAAAAAPPRRRRLRG